MKLRSIAFAFAAASSFALSACVSEEGYRQHMDLLTGRSSDEIMVNWGPPQNRSTLSDGRELWSYTKVTVTEQPEYVSDEQREVKRTFTDKDGKQKTETITETYPVRHPAQTLRSTCTTRFVMAGGRVDSVAFDGPGCVAEELN